MTREEIYKKIEAHYRENYDDLVGVYTRRTGRREIAEEVVQEGYTNACQWWKPKTNGLTNIDAWINRIVWHAFVKINRAERRHGGTLDINSVPEELLIDFAQDPERRAIAEEFLELMADDPRAEMIRYILLEDWTNEEAAGYFGISKQRVNVVVQRFIDRMRNEDRHV